MLFEIIIKLYPFSVCFCTFKIILLSSFRRPSNKEEAVSLFQVSDSRTGAGILFQRLHQQGEEAPAFPNVEPNRPPGQNLVSEQKNEREEAEQRSPAVLLWKPPVVSRKSVTRGMQAFSFFSSSY